VVCRNRETFLHFLLLPEGFRLASPVAHKSAAALCLLPLRGRNLSPVFGAVFDLKEIKIQWAEVRGCDCKDDCDSKSDGEM